MILVLLLVTATFRPAQPAVGDLVTIDFGQPVVLEASAEYEVVKHLGTQVVVRTFKPQPFELRGQVGNVKFRNLKLPVRSVLKQGDDLAPAPLRPPQRIDAPRLPWMLIGAGALLAAAIWFGVWRLSKRVFATPQIATDPATRFRQRVLALRNDARAPRRWAELADATREYLGLTTLTTTEVLGGAPPPTAALIADILRQGDLDKFSPWGPAPMDFERLADRALELVDNGGVSPSEELAA